MTTIGSIESYDPAKEDWNSYAERFEQYVIANELKDEKKIVAVFLTSVGSKSYNLLRDLKAPAKPSEFKLAELLKTLSNHFQPKPIIIAERFHFHKRDQDEGEGVADYAAALKRCSERCEFGEFLEQALRDRFVCGMRNRQIQKRLLTETELTWKKALETAIAMESAEKQANHFRPTAPPSNINVLPARTQNKQGRKPREQKSCFRCGGNHTPQTCRFKDQTCHFCQNKGHIQKVCRKKGAAKQERENASKRSNPVHYLEDEQGVAGNFSIFKVEDETAEPAILIHITMNGSKIPMELDTGATLSVMSEETWKETCPTATLQQSSARLSTYSGEPLTVLGKAMVNVEYEGQTENLPLQIIKGSGPSLFGRNWLSKIRLNWPTIKKISNELDRVLDKHPEVFKDELGTLKDVKAQLFVKPEAIPKFYKPRPVPHAIKGAIEQELDRLENMGVLEKVRFSNWAAPIVPVVKSDGGVRICGDYKVTVNSTLEVDQHPLPNPEELFVALSGGEKFTKLDLSRAYQQILLEENSRGFVTINTHKGLYRPTRLPFGVSSASAIFQSKIEQVLQAIPMVVCRVDDILISGKNDQEHVSNLSEVLTRLETAGLRLKLSKCKFMQPSVEYLGYRVDASGLHAIEKKVQAIRDAPAPENQQQLRSFLGMVNYYSKFISNYSMITHPLNELLRDGIKWKWSKSEEDAFAKLKDKLAKAPVLVHYQNSLPLKLDTDASHYGVGAVISHVFPNGEEKPIAFASRTLNKSERNYAQIEKEALSIIFGIKKFHQYLYGRKFSLVTDHKPLVTLLGPKTGIPTLAAARLQRWAILLSAYQYEIEYRSTLKHANADCLSRLPLPVGDNSEEFDEVKLINSLQIGSLPLTAGQIRKATRADPVLSRVVEYTMTGWSDDENSAVRAYYQRRNELTVEEGCLLWGIRVVIPSSLRERVLQELHEGHPGIVRMKSLARLHVWWPKLDQSIASVVRDCAKCQLTRNKPQTAPLHPWDWPDKPWQRIHIDFAGPFMNKMFLVVVDSHSKWLEVEIMPSVTSESTIEKLRNMFARYGVPMQLVSDNGPQFTSREFENFVKQNGIKHTLIAPYHPRSNGQAERFVQTFKQYFKTEESSSITQSLARFLFSNRTTPSSVTGQAPAELFLKRRPRTRLDLLRPNLGRKIFDRQAYDKAKYDRKSKEREFSIGEEVLVQNFRGEPRWLDATVVERTGPVSYKTQIGEQVWRRHVDQMRGKSYHHTSETSVKAPIPLVPNQNYEMPQPESLPEHSEVGKGEYEPGDSAHKGASNRESANLSPNADQPARYPSRTRKPPIRLGYDE